MKRWEYIAGACLVGMPLFATPFRPFREGWELFAIWMAVVAWSFWLRSWWWRIFAWLALLQLVWHPAAVSFKTMAMIVMFLSAAQLFSRMPPGLLLDLIGLSGLAHVVLIGLQQIGVVPDLSGYNRSAGFFNPDAAGVFLALCLPAFFRGPIWQGAGGRGLHALCSMRSEATKVCWWHLLLFVIPAIAITGTTTGMAAAAAAVMIYGLLFFKRRVQRLGMVLVLVSGLGLFTWKIDPLMDMLTGPRWIVWQHTARTFQSETWGRGLGSYGEIFPFFMSGDRRLTSVSEPRDFCGVPVRQMSTVWKRAHNEYLQVWFEMGLQALFLIIAWLGYAAIKTKKYRLQRNNPEPQILYAASGIAALSVSCLGWFTLHIAPLALIAMAWIGMWVGRARKIEELRN